MEKVQIPAAPYYVVTNDRLFSGFNNPAITLVFPCYTLVEYRNVWRNVKYGKYTYRMQRTEKVPQINYDQDYAVLTKDIAPMYYKGI